MFKALHFMSQLETSGFYWKGRIQLFSEIHNICVAWHAGCHTQTSQYSHLGTCGCRKKALYGILRLKYCVFFKAKILKRSKGSLLSKTDWHGAWLDAVEVWSSDVTSLMEHEVLLFGALSH